MDKQTKPLNLTYAAFNSFKTELLQALADSKVPFSTALDNAFCKIRVSVEPSRPTIDVTDADVRVFRRDYLYYNGDGENSARFALEQFAAKYSAPERKPWACTSEQAQAITLLAKESFRKFMNATNKAATQDAIYEVYAQATNEVLGLDPAPERPTTADQARWLMDYAVGIHLRYLHRNSAEFAELIDEVRAGSHDTSIKPYSVYPENSEHSKPRITVTAEHAALIRKEFNDFIATSLNAGSSILSSVIDVQFANIIERVLNESA